MRGHTDCKNTDSRNNVKFVHLIAVCSFHSEGWSDFILLCLSFHWRRLGPTASPLDHMHTLITALSTLSQFLQQFGGMSQWIYSSAQCHRVSESEVYMTLEHLEHEPLRLKASCSLKTSWTTYLTTHHHELLTSLHIMNRLPHYTSWTAYFTTQHHKPLT